MSETLDVVPGAEIARIESRTIDDFSRDEIAAIHISDHTVFGVVEMLSEAEHRMRGLAARTGIIVRRVARTEPLAETQLELI